jgi:hypothetical protein
MNRRFGGTYHFNHQAERIIELGATLAVTSNRSTHRSNNFHPVDGGFIDLRSHRRENLKFYIALTGWAL